MDQISLRHRFGDDRKMGELRHAEVLEPGVSRAEYNGNTTGEQLGDRSVEPLMAIQYCFVI